MISPITNPTNAHRQLNPHAPPFPSKSAAAVLPPLLPHQMHNQQFPVPAPQPAGMPVGFSCPPGQHMLWHTSVTFSPPIQRRDVYWVYSQPFWPNNSGGVGYSSAEEPFFWENAGMDCSSTGLVRRENKLGASARRSVARRKYVNGRRAIQQKKWTAKKPNDDAVPLPSSSTSLMIKNIPNQFERHTLLNILDRHCLEENTKSSSGSDEPSFSKSEYDFTYLPMDFRRGANKGYAFVNFTTAVGAARFAKAFEKHQWRVSVNKKICEVTIANIQGKDALQNHFKNSAFPCRKTSYLPVVFSPPRDGFIRTPPTLVGRLRQVFNIASPSDPASPLWKAVMKSCSDCWSGHMWNMNGISCFHCFHCLPKNSSKFWGELETLEL